MRALALRFWAHFKNDWLSRLGGVEILPYFLDFFGAPGEKSKIWWGSARVPGEGEKIPGGVFFGTAKFAQKAPCAGPWGDKIVVLCVDGFDPGLGPGVPLHPMI